MRVKFLAIATGVFAIALGGVASGALQQTEEVSVKTKGPGEYTTISAKISNTDPVKVPERISQIVVSSKLLKWNAKGAAVCSLQLRSDGEFMSPKCPANTVIGKGTFRGVLGIPGKAYPTDSLGKAGGTITLYNYKPPAGTKVGILAEAHTIKDANYQSAAEATQYILGGVTAAGKETIDIPNLKGLPPQLRDIIPPCRFVVFTEANINLTPPKPKKGKAPFVTTKKGNIDASIQYVREEYTESPECLALLPADRN